MLLFAVVRAVEIIGEAATHVSEELLCEIQKMDGAPGRTGAHEGAAGSPASRFGCAASR